MALGDLSLTYAVGEKVFQDQSLKGVDGKI